MSTFQVIVERSSLEVNNRGSLTGQLWMELDGQPFPEPLWNDFALVVLGWWCQAVSDMVCARVTEGEMRFMDGNFSVRIHTGPEGHLRLVAVTGNDCEVAACSSSVEKVRRELVAAAKVVLEFCESRHLDSEDVRALEAGVSALGMNTSN